MKTGLFVLLGGLAAGALAAPFDGHDHVVHQKRDVEQPGWVKREPLHADTKMSVRIALKQRNLERGMDYLMEVSDPRSELYGRHYSADEVVERFAPSADSIDAVKKWLVDSGIAERDIQVPRSKAWVHFDARTSELESLLKTRYHVYEHVSARGEHVGTDMYHLPREVSPHVDFVVPGVAFAKRRSTGVEKRSSVGSIGPVSGGRMPAAMVSELKSNGPLSMCDQVITPACIKAMYNIPDATLASPDNFMGIFEDEDVYVRSDLKRFLELFATGVPNGTRPSVDRIDGAVATGGIGQAEGEADLDLMVSFPIIFPQQITIFDVNTEGTDDLFNTFLDAVDGSYCTFSADGETGDDPKIDGKNKHEMCGAFKPAHVISISYGTSEALYPSFYLERQCTEFMKLGLQGTTVVIASGDDGVATRAGPCLGPKKNIFVPDTGASCPFVTSVGATLLPKGAKVGGEEVAVKSFSSGGGFSNIFTTPSYQSAAVSTYFSAHDPGYAFYNTSNGTIPTTGGIYNRGGRGYPDLSAVGDNGAFVFNAEEVLSGGTSMATPVVASIFNLINEERIAAGKPVIGFANPVLYANPQMFTDVTVGNQDKGGPNGDNQKSECGNNGFSAVAGWDPVTGLGTPKFPAMLKAFMSV